MGNSLMAGVSGLKANQKMLDVTGNNLANINTTSFKASRVSFTDLLSETLQEASQPTENVGGTNPQQIGSGVRVASIDRDMTQGGMSSTGRSLDMAIEGEGFFVLNDGNKNVYTRGGAFSVDSDYYLVDPSTGYRVQRIGSVGEEEGFQEDSENGVRIPYDTILPTKATEHITYTGNLSSDEIEPTTNKLTSGISYTVGSSSASETSLLKDLDQTSGLSAGDSIDIEVTKRDGTTDSTTYNVTDPATDTVQDLIDVINDAYGADSGTTASIVNGEITVADDEAGYSQADINLSYSGEGSFKLPKYFECVSAGGEVVKDTNIEIFDSQGNSHTLSASFVRSDTNKWDMVLTSVTGDVELADRRIKGIQFMSDGSFGGLESDTESASFKMKFSHDPDNTREINVDLGAIGDVNGLSQFGGGSTASASEQDGYEAGYLSDVSMTSDGVMMGAFTNGIRKELATLKVATFQNAAGLNAIGNNMYEATANSGNATEGQAMSGNAGSIEGGTIEGSNVDTAEEFVNLIQAQNGYQANARTIKVTNEMLRELTNLIR